MPYIPAQESKTFIYRSWNPAEIWCGLTHHDSNTDNDEAIQAREFFWEKHQAHIVAELNQWQDQGWNLTNSLDSSAIKLRKTTRCDVSFDLADILLWVMTLGVALILQLFLGDPVRWYVLYSPIELRVQLSRPVKMATYQSNDHVNLKVGYQDWLISGLGEGL